MTDKSQERALILLEQAKEKGDLDPAVEARLAELVGTEARPQLEEVFETSATTEAEKRELTSEQADSLVSTLKSRFEVPENERLRKMIDFADVEKSLRATPEKLYTLQKLEETGGEPQVIGIDGDEFVFEDRCKESPSGRKSMSFDQSLAQAEEFGADMQSPDAYKAMQKAGRYDLETWSWLKTDPEHLEKTCGAAMYGHCHTWSGSDVVVIEYDSALYYHDYGWRASLRVKKV
jgi:hypothetical protein